MPHFGRLALEVRPVAEVNKGVAARRLVEAAGAEMALFGGDDTTDLDAFGALRQMAEKGDVALAVCVGIASADGPAEIQREADLVVAGPDGFLDLLRSL